MTTDSMTDRAVFLVAFGAVAVVMGALQVFFVSRIKGQIKFV